MRKFKLLIAACALLVCAGVQAQSWTAPTLSGDDPVSGTTYKLYNVGAGMYLAEGQSWFSWTTTAVLAGNGADFTFTGDASSFTLTTHRSGNNKVFTSGNNIPGDAMHVDGQGATNYGLTKMPNGYYHIHDAGGNESSTCWGYGIPSGQTKAGVVAHADANADGWSCDWMFISAAEFSLYNARVNLYNLLLKAEGEGANTDAASTVYNNASATVDEVNAACSALNLVRVEKYLEGKTASEENPIEITEYVLINPDFEIATPNGQLPPGWTITITGQNCGQMNRTDTNPLSGLAISNFIEAWHPNALGAGVIAQTVSSLPEGTYVLACDASVCHDDPDSSIGGLGKSDGSDIVGAYLFIKSSLKTEKDALGNRRLDIQHYSVSFSHGGTGEVQFGLMATDEINANWLSADNFKIFYAGAVDLSVFVTALAEAVADFEALESSLNATSYAQLKAMVDALNTTYSSSADYQTAIDNVHAINDYATALAAAEAVDQTQKMNASVLSALQTELGKATEITLATITGTTAAADLASAAANATTSIANYANLYNYMLQCANIVKNYDQNGQDAFEPAATAAYAAYQNGTATDCQEEIAALKAALAAACKVQTQPGDGCDMSPWIVNPGIDGNLTGWTTNKYGNTVNTGGPMKPSYDAMEYWGHTTVKESDAGKGFDYYQTITGLPNGIYTIGADLLHSTNGEEGAEWNGGGTAGVYGKTGSAEVIELVTIDGATNDQIFMPYTTDEIVVYDGTLTIGVKNIAALTGRWFACDNFKLTYVRQLEEGDKTTFTASFVNGEGWEKVCAYAWNTDTDVKTAVWPGDVITKSGTKNYNGTPYDVYTYSITDYGMPKNIIFNQGDDQKKTADLTFVDGMVNDDFVTKVPVYAVVGSNLAEDDKAIFSGIWDVATTTDLMEEENGVWKKNYSVTLDPQTIAFKVIKRDYLEATTASAWYPENNQQIVIAENGIYNIVITFDGTNVNYTCTDTQEKFTVTDAGWATAVTYNAVDFTGNEKIKAYLATVSDNQVTLTEASKVPAGTPLVLKGETAKVNIVESADAVTNDLQGSNIYDYVINDEMDAQFNFYGLTVSDGKAKFAKLNKGTIQPGKAYLKLEKTPTARQILDVVFAGDATGINGVVAEKVQDGVYNLNGQRVAAPQKGLYIVNGKKVILK